MSLDTLPKVSDPYAKAEWVDSSSVLIRGENRIATLIFYYFMPDAAIEVCRLQTSKDHLIALINMLSQATGHYPERPAEKSQAE
jgi:hypothetical protein